MKTLTKNRWTRWNTTRATASACTRRSAMFPSSMVLPFTRCPRVPLARLCHASGTGQTLRDEVPVMRRRRLVGRALAAEAGHVEGGAAFALPVDRRQLLSRLLEPTVQRALEPKRRLCRIGRDTGAFRVDGAQSILRRPVELFRRSLIKLDRRSRVLVDAHAVEQEIGIGGFS